MGRSDIYESLTARIIERVEAGDIPWKRPWATYGPPRNVLNGRPYRGINVLLLSIDGYRDPRWGTFKALREAAAKQAISEGREIVTETVAGRRGFDKTLYYEIVDGEKTWFRGGVRKDEKGTRILLRKPVKRTKENDAGEAEDASYWLLNEYVVFNGQQADGIPPLVEDPREFTPIESAQRIVDAYVNSPGPYVKSGYRHACYVPSTDMLEMPEPEDFYEDEGFYSTVFHELVHSTGHKSRLDRIESTAYGSDPYAKEELVAEIGASFLAGIAGLSVAGGEQSAAYVQGWLEALRGSRTLVVQAAAAAQKAADLILGTTVEATNNHEEAKAA